MWHAIASDGCFSQDGDFHMTPGFMLEDLEERFLSLDPGQTVDKGRILPPSG
jgi:hypothetical protein